MTETPMQTAAVGGQERRTIHLSAYVDLSIDGVVDLLAARPAIELLLERVVREVLGADEADLALGVGAVVRVSDGSASMALSWTVRNGNNRLVPGTAELAVLLVQSGRNPVTELLLTIAVPEPHHLAVARTLHAVLDSVTAELARSASS